MECSEFLSRFSDFYDAPPQSPLRRQAEVHLEGCEKCARYGRAVASGAALLKTLPRVELSESFRPTLEHRLFHLEDENMLARATGASAVPVLTAVGLAVVIAIVAWAPKFTRTSVQVDLAPEELGFLQQAELLQWAEEELGQRCPVVDSADLLQAPARVLEGLCAALGIPWTERMLSWAPGPRETDGVWARHWYANVERSSGFVPRAQAQVELDPVLEPVVEGVQAAYEMLRQRCITG